MTLCLSDDSTCLCDDIMSLCDDIIIDGTVTGNDKLLHANKKVSFCITCMTEGKFIFVVLDFVNWNKQTLKMYNSLMLCKDKNAVTY